MFKTCWISAFCSLAVAAWLHADDPDVVVRLMKDGKPESVMVASGSGRPKAGRLTLKDPNLYLFSPDAPMSVARVELKDLSEFTRKNPESVARWTASDAVITVAPESGGSWTLGGVRGLKFSGGAQLDFGFGERRSTFRSEVVDVSVDRFDVPGKLTWESGRWILRATSARATLKDTRIFAERGPVPDALLKGLKAVRLGGRVVVDARPEDGRDPIRVEAPRGAVAQVTDDLVHIRMDGEVTLTQGDMTVKMTAPRGILGPHGWEWFEGASPDVVQKAAGPAGGDLVLKGDQVTMNRSEMIVSGRPVRISSGDWHCDTPRVRRDLATGRLRIRDPEIRPKKQNPRKETAP